MRNGAGQKARREEGEIRPAMMNKQYRLWYGSTIVLTIASCAHVDKVDSFRAVEQATDARLGLHVHWRAGSAEGRSVTEAIRLSLSHELTADSGTQIALLNNRSLQAEYERIGIALADVVQAGLLRNPVFAASARIPDVTPSGTNVGLDVVGDFLYVLMLPAQKRIAREQFERVQLAVTQVVLDLAANTRVAFLHHQADLQCMKVLLDIADVADAAATFARELHTAGNLSDLELAKHEVEAENVQLELAAAEAGSSASREHLTRLMGLWGSETDYRIADSLAEIPEAESRLDNMESLAVAQRLDLQAMHWELRKRGHELDLIETWRWLGSLEVGVSAEREADRQWKTGPSLSLELPVFDQHQADIARVDSERRQVEHEFYALAVQIRSEVREARFRLLAARSMAQRFRDGVLPLRRKIVEKTQEEYNFMLTGAFDLRDAKSAELRAVLDSIEAIRDYWIARTELERAIGGRMPFDGGDLGQPVMSEPTARHIEKQHHHEGGGP